MTGSRVSSRHRRVWAGVVACAFVGVAAPAAFAQVTTPTDVVRHVRDLMGRQPSLEGRPGVAVADEGRGDPIYSIPGTRPGNPGPDVDLVGAMALRVDHAPWVEEVFANAACADDPLTTGIVCPFDAGGPPPPPPPSSGGDVLIVAFQASGPLPWGPAGTGEPGTYYEYGLVLDTDGDPANDFVAQNPYAWDFFQGTDTWLTLNGYPGEPPALFVTDANRVFQPSNARVVLEDDLWVFLLDGSTVAPGAGWRGSTFRSSDGSYAAEDSAGDVTGADPTLPLLAVPAESTSLPVLTDGPAVGPTGAPTSTSTRAAQAPTGGGDASEEPAAAERPDSSFPLGLGIAAAVVLVAGGGWLWSRSRRSGVTYAPGVTRSEIRDLLDDELAPEDLSGVAPPSGGADIAAGDEDRPRFAGPGDPDLAEPGVAPDRYGGALADSVAGSSPPSPPTGLSDAPHPPIEAPPPTRIKPSRMVSQTDGSATPEARRSEPQVDREARADADRGRREAAWLLGDLLDEDRDRLSDISDAIRRAMSSWPRRDDETSSFLDFSDEVERELTIRDEFWRFWREQVRRIRSKPADQRSDLEDQALETEARYRRFWEAHWGADAGSDRGEDGDDGGGVVDDMTPIVPLS